jgi:hypothetical protein
MKLKYKANYACCMNGLKSTIQDLEKYQMRMTNQYYDLGFNNRWYSYNISPFLKFSNCHCSWKGGRKWEEI